MQAERRRAGVQARHRGGVGLDELIEPAMESLAPEVAQKARLLCGSCLGEHPVPVFQARAGILVRLDPGWRHPRVAQQVVGKAHLAFTWIIVQLERSTLTRQVVEVAALL